jgi:hypothetical protein
MCHYRVKEGTASLSEATWPGQESRKQTTGKRRIDSSKKREKANIVEP